MYSDSYGEGDGMFEFINVVEGRTYRRALVKSTVVSIAELLDNCREVGTQQQNWASTESYDELVARRWPNKEE